MWLIIITVQGEHCWLIIMTIPQLHYWSSNNRHSNSYWTVVTSIFIYFEDGFSFVNDFSISIIAISLIDNSMPYFSLVSLKYQSRQNTWHVCKHTNWHILQLTFCYTETSVIFHSKDTINVVINVLNIKHARTQ